jgi:hypothetical protein
MGRRAVVMARGAAALVADAEAATLWADDWQPTTCGRWATRLAQSLPMYA